MTSKIFENGNRDLSRQQNDETTLEKMRREIQNYTDHPLEVKIIDRNSPLKNSSMNAFNLNRLQELYPNQDHNNGRNEERENKKEQISMNEKFTPKESMFTDIALIRANFAKDVMKTEILSKQCQNIVNREIGMWIDRNMFEMQQIKELKEDLISRNTQVSALNRELRQILDSLQQNWCISK
uniref:Uncharacterized protein n=2 Tax=Parascaris univalens TaxID=6257 RepID=A0A915CFY1_PARUN